MDRYSPVLRKFLLLVFELWFQRIEEELQLFAEALDAWLHEVFQDPRPDWRESFEQFLAEQEAEGRTLTPESHQDLLDYLENWAKTVDWNAVAGGTSADDQPIVVVVTAKSEPKRRTDLKNWPALTPSQLEAAQSATGLPGWYPVQPRNRMDSVWQKLLENHGRSARGQLLAFFRKVATLGRMSRAIKVPEEADVEPLFTQQKKVQQAYERYIQAKIHIYREWTRYLSMESFVGPEVGALFTKIDGALPNRVEGLESSLYGKLEAARRAIDELSDKKVRRTDAAYTALVWTDNVIAVIELATLVGSAKAVFTQTAKKLAAKGLSRAATRSAAVAYTVAHLGTAAATAAVVGNVVPELLIDAGLNEANIRAGLTVFRTLFTLVGVRAVGKQPVAKRKGTPARNSSSPSVPKKMRRRKNCSVSSEVAQRVE